MYNQNQWSCSSRSLAYHSGSVTSRATGRSNVNNNNVRIVTTHIHGTIRSLHLALHLRQLFELYDIILRVDLSAYNKSHGKCYCNTVTWELGAGHWWLVNINLGQTCRVEPEETHLNVDKQDLCFITVHI